MLGTPTLSRAVLSAAVIAATLMPLAGSGCRFLDVGKPDGYVNFSYKSPITFVVNDRGEVSIQGEVTQVVGPFKVQAGFTMPIGLNPDGKRLVIAFRDRLAEAVGIDSYYAVNSEFAEFIRVLDGNRAFEPGNPLIIDITDHRPRQVALVPRTEIPRYMPVESVPDEAIDGDAVILPTEALPAPVLPTALPYEPTVVPAEPTALPTTIREFLELPTQIQIVPVATTDLPTDATSDAVTDSLSPTTAAYP